MVGSGLGIFAAQFELGERNEHLDADRGVGDLAERTLQEAPRVGGRAGIDRATPRLAQELAEGRIASRLAV